MQSIFSGFTIWVLTAMLNSLLAGTVIPFFSNEFNYWPSTIFLVFIFTLLFSIPGMFIFWLIFLFNWESGEVFRTLLKTVFIISTLSSLVVFMLPVGMDKGELPLLIRCIVIAAISFIMINHAILKSITANNKNENYV